jgi:tRNA dimethylallyltransferase
MDITRYVSLARAALEDIEHRGRTPLVVGGSGFYLKAFFAPVADDLSVPDDIRQEVAKCSLEVAVERLRALNPEGLEGIDLANPRRVTRALERCLASGETLAQLKSRFAQMPGPFADRKIVATRIDRPPPELECRIADRVDQMLRSGLVDEVQRLLQAGLRENPSASKAIGYREVIDCIDGRLPKTQLAGEIVKNTRALVKKQRACSMRTRFGARRSCSSEARSPSWLTGWIEQVQLVSLEEIQTLLHRARINAEAGALVRFLFTVGVQVGFFPTESSVAFSAREIPLDLV